MSVQREENGQGEIETTAFATIKSISPSEPFVSFDRVINVPPNDSSNGNFRWKLEHDLRLAFSAQERATDESYSAGNTFFIDTKTAPRCFLEALAQHIYKLHVRDGTDDKLDDSEFVSGVEWWTLVLDDDEDNGSDSDDDNDLDDDMCEVGLHYDADYGLEAQTNGNIVVHPLIATVTYFSNYGAPTCIFDSIRGSDTICSSNPIQGSVHNIERIFCSAPKLGKHIAFEGSLVHGAPSTIFQSPLAHEKSKDADRNHERKKLKIVGKEEIMKRVRLTFLANIWLGHRPIDADPLPPNIANNMKLKACDLKIRNEEDEEQNEGTMKKRASTSDVLEDRATWVADLSMKQTVEIVKASESHDTNNNIEAEIGGRSCKICFQRMIPKKCLNYGQSIIGYWKSGSCILRVGESNSDCSEDEN